jgi:glutamate-ammonia-ligase adenylyltransferase
MQAATDLLLRAQQRFNDTLAQQSDLKALLDASPAQALELPALWLASDHAFEVCNTNPELLADLLSEGDLVRNYDNWQQHLERFQLRCLPYTVDLGADAVPSLQRLLRRFRQREWLRIVWRDVHCLATLEQTCADLTALADACIRHALPLLQRQVERMQGVPFDATGRRQQLIVLAMGKYGAGELNLSSDIDLIYAFAEDGETRLDAETEKHYPLAQPCTIQAFFVRLGQLLLSVLDTRTPDGFVFRVDLRLRPYGSAGALALSHAALEEYYHSQGRDWERFAMIKVRAVTGDAGDVQLLMQMLRGFTYRRYLDFATIESLRDLKRQIEQQVRRKGMLRNIKLGNGGIREIEFVVQVFQLIHGGRRKPLQQPALRVALVELVEGAYLTAEDAAALYDSYRFLRRLEHAIQALRDAQTHDYPDDPLSEHRIAVTLGYIEAAQLREQLAAVRAKVAQHFHDVIGRADDDKKENADVSLQQLWLGNVDSERAQAFLTEAGYTDAATLLQTLDNFRRSRQFLGLDRSSRERLDRFMPVLLTRVARSETPTQAFLRVFTFVQAVVQRTVYMVLLLENPLALQQLITLCNASPWVVELLSRYPVLLDELLRPLKQPPLLPELRSQLQRQLLRSTSGDLEDQLGIIQYFKQEQVLNVAAAELSGSMSIMKVSDYLTWIAESVVEQLLQLAWQQLTARHGYPCNQAGHSGDCDFIIIAYGKLGGLELSYGSDLDLVFVHDGHAELDTTGGGSSQPLNSTAFYVQLAQKILALLGTQTLVGKLYEIDLRLRPSGASGALVSSLEAFDRYQQREAWTWEHQALVRARVITGAPGLTARFEAVRTNILTRERDLEKLRSDITHMRERMLQQHGSKHTNRFDLKQDSGGLIDIEFMVQYLVLANAHVHPDFLRWSDNMRLLDTAVTAGVLDSTSAETLQMLYLTYRSELHRLALNLASSVLEADAFALERKDVQAIWHRLFPQKPANETVA